MENCKAAHDSGDAHAFMEAVRHTLRVLDKAHTVGLACQERRAVDLERRRDRERREVLRLEEEQRKRNVAKKRRELEREAEERREMRREEEHMLTVLAARHQARLRIEKSERQVRVYSVVFIVCYY
jgi:hypothetical protein